MMLQQAVRVLGSLDMPYILAHSLGALTLNLYEEILLLQLVHGGTHQCSVCSHTSEEA